MKILDCLRVHDQHNPPYPPWGGRFARASQALLVALAVALTVSPPALADGPLAPGATAVTTTATRGDSCTPINATGAANAQIILTIPAQSGMYGNITALDLTVSANGTGGTVNTNLSWTSTNLGSWRYLYSFVDTANTMQSEHFAYGTPMKGPAVGTAIVITSPAATANTAFNINACYFYSQN